MVQFDASVVFLPSIKDIFIKNLTLWKIESKTNQCINKVLIKFRKN